MQHSQSTKEIEKENSTTEVSKKNNFKNEIIDKLIRLKYKEYANRKLNGGD